MEQITYELKYCERCGALCTRRSHSVESFCESCAQILTTTLSLPEAAPGHWRRRQPRRRKVALNRIESFASCACGRVQ